LEITKTDVEKYLNDHYPENKLLKFDALGTGVHGTGYLIEFEHGGETNRLILKTLFPQGFGHDYPADRAQVLLQANAAYNLLPRHARSIDVIGVAQDELVSMGDSQEFFILMEEVEGRSYFNDLEDIKARGSLTDMDKERALKLSDYLADIHSEKHDDPILYKRKIRDTIGHGECLMGVLDVYPEVKFVTDEEMTELVAKAVRWWGKLKNRSERLCVVHGDYHPGNIWFQDNGDFVLLDRSRGIYGDPGDDVSCLLMNYIFYALQQHNEFTGDFRVLYELFYNNYVEKTGDTDIAKVMAPFFAFRSVVVGNPLFYPDVTDEVRRAVFNFANSILEVDEIIPADINSYIKE
jgi:hypothetical protein